MAWSTSPAVHHWINSMRVAGAGALGRLGEAIAPARERTELTTADLQMTDAFVQKVRKDEALAAQFARSVTTVCLLYSTRRDDALLTKLVRDVAATVELHADPRYEIANSRSSARSDTGRTVDELFTSLSHR